MSTQKVSTRFSERIIVFRFIAFLVVAVSIVFAGFNATSISADHPNDICHGLQGDQPTLPPGYMIDPANPNRCVSIATATAVPTATPVATQTPVIVTNTVTIFCEGPINLSAYGYFGNVLTFSNYNAFGLAYPYNGVFNWAVPTLVTRVNGVVDFNRTFPNHPACLPRTVIQPTAVPAIAPPIPTPIVIKEQVFVDRPVAAAPRVVQPAPRVIAPPKTGNAGLADALGMETIRDRVFSWWGFCEE